MGDQDTTFLVCQMCHGTFIQGQVAGQSCPLCAAERWGRIMKTAAPFIESANRAAAEAAARAFYGLPG